MNVLIACEESQRVCLAFRERGHNAFSADLQECSGGHPEWHYVGDCLDLVYMRKKCFETESGAIYQMPQWDLLIAHPPCTYLSVAGACNLVPNGRMNYDRLRKGFEAADFFCKMLNAPIEHICVENPRPIARFGLPPRSQVIEPWWFDEVGDEQFTKRTYLWLKNLPYLTPTTLWSSGDVQSWTSIHSSSKIRSKTFFGVAAAMADQWNDEILKGYA